MGIHFFYFLSHKAKLRDALRINLFLVTKAHRLERQNRFAVFAHRLDLILKARRGGGGPKLAGRIDVNRTATGGGYARNAGDKGTAVQRIADADRIGVTSFAVVANKDIEIPRGEISAAYQYNVVGAGAVAIERLMTDGHVV